MRFDASMESLINTGRSESFVDLNESDLALSRSVLNQGRDMFMSFQGNETQRKCQYVFGVNVLRCQSEWWIQQNDDILRSFEISAKFRTQPTSNWHPPQMATNEIAKSRWVESFGTVKSVRNPLNRKRHTNRNRFFQVMVLVAQRGWTMNRSVDHQSSMESVSVKMQLPHLHFEAFNRLIWRNWMIKNRHFFYKFE